MSDHESRPVGRAFAPIHYDEQLYSISALQEALGAANESRDKWKARAQELDDDLADTRKDKKEIEARWHAVIDRNELIEAEKKKLYNEKKAIAEENASLREQVAALQAALEKAVEKAAKKSSSSGSSKSKSAESSPPPTMSGAIPATTTSDATAAPPKMRRSSSRSKRDKAGEAEQAQKEKARLSRRFEQRSDESSDGNSASTAKSHRSRRASYVEPMGPAAARPVVAQQVPPSPTRHYNNYTAASQYPSHQYPSIREPAANLPRSVHPAVSYVYEEPKGHYYAPDHHSQRESSRR